MQFFLDVEASYEAGPLYEFSLTDINSYVELVEFAPVLAASTKANTLQRVVFIRGIPHPNKR